MSISHSSVWGFWLHLRISVYVCFKFHPQQNLIGIERLFWTLVCLSTNYIVCWRRKVILKRCITRSVLFSLLIFCSYRIYCSGFWSNQTALFFTQCVKWTYLQTVHTSILNDFMPQSVSSFACLDYGCLVDSITVIPFACERRHASVIFVPAALCQGCLLSQRCLLSGRISQRLHLDAGNSQLRGRLHAAVQCSLPNHLILPTAEGLHPCGCVWCSVCVWSRAGRVCTKSAKCTEHHMHCTAYCVSRTVVYYIVAVNRSIW